MGFVFKTIHVYFTYALISIKIDFTILSHQSLYPEIILEKKTVQMFRGLITIDGINNIII